MGNEKQESQAWGLMNVYIKNKRSRVPQSVTPEGMKAIMRDPKLNQKIEICGLADEKGRPLPDTLAKAREIYSPLIVTKVGVIKPIEDMAKNVDQGESNKLNMD